MAAAPAPRPAPLPDADLAGLVARFGEALRAEGVPAGPERCARFAEAVQLVQPARTGALYWCAQATLIADPAHEPLLARVFGRVFGGPAGSVLTPARPVRSELAGQAARQPGGEPGTGSTQGRPGPAGDAGWGLPQQPRQPPWTQQYPAMAAAAERLAQRDFSELTPAELATLAAAMRRLRLAPPLRPSRRRRGSDRRGPVDLRATLRRASHTAGQPLRLRRRAPRWRRRRLVVLCDISGSMAPYARAVLQLLYCAAGGAAAPGSEVFTFATRLTRLTRAMRQVPPGQALERAGRLAPDWSGGTRIGAALQQFTDRYGARGMARGAVLVIVSDGWETGDPAELGRALARLSKLAYRIVWVNPRVAGIDYQPLVRGMAAAWPYCDAVVSGHRLAALDELLAAVSAPRREHRTPRGVPTGRDRTGSGNSAPGSRRTGHTESRGAGEVDAGA